MTWLELQRMAWDAWSEIRCTPDYVTLPPETEKQVQVVCAQYCQSLKWPQMEKPVLQGVANRVHRATALCLRHRHEMEKQIEPQLSDRETLLWALSQERGDYAY